MAGDELQNLLADLRKEMDRIEKGLDAIDRTDFEDLPGLFHAYPLNAHRS